MRFTSPFAAIFLFAFLFLNCHDAQKHHNSAQEHLHSHNFDDLVKSFDDPARDNWQKPADVLNFLVSRLPETQRNKLSKVTFADLGAGSGYFTFRLLDRGAKVIALDLDDRFLSLIKKRAESHAQKNNLQIRKATASESGLKASEVDGIISVDVYHHIDNRIPYFMDLSKTLAKSGFICIIDFKEGDLPVGPPASMKISRKQIVDELTRAGYDVQVESALLQYQDIYLARPRK